MNDDKLEIYLSAILHQLQLLKVGDLPETERNDTDDDIIAEAVKLASGTPRQNGGEGSYPNKVSLLQNINHGNIVSTDWKVKPCKLNLKSDSFPINENKGDAKAEREKLWGEFVEQFKYVQANDKLSFAESLLSLLFLYTTNLPAGSGYPDVSLYDHIKTTAAMAVCLKEHKQKGDAIQSPFLLIGGDMSGIQTYIYEIVSKYAAKNLKGRSFYLRLLSDAVVRFLLKELGLFRGNIIYDSGGCFYLLAPNTQETRDKLAKAIDIIEDKLFNAHGTRLYLAIDAVEIPRETLLHQGDKTLSKVWHDLFERRDKKKQARWSKQLKENYEKFFEPSLAGGDSWRDVITGEEAPKDEKPFKVKNFDGNLRELTARQILLGQALRNTAVMAVSDHKLNTLDNDNDITSIEPANLGYVYYFLSQQEMAKYNNVLQGEGGHVTLVTFNGGKNSECNFALQVKGLKNIVSLQFYGGNEWNGETFEDMCKNEGSFERLGILRMDVDNLGSIFQKGIADEQATLSRYAELSRSFDWFFSGYINSIKDDTLIIYSGGDDLFIVGDWSKTIAVAEKIRSDFGKFTCGNDAFSISGGVAIVTKKFPIMKGAEESDNEEKNAKTHTCKGKSKNSLSLLGYALNWETEFNQVKELKKRILQSIKNNSLPSSFISKVMTHWLNADFKNHQIRNVKTYWMMTYDMTRMYDRIKKENAEARAIVNACKNECCQHAGTLGGKDITTDYHPLELWALAARWAELENRTNNN